MKKTYNLTIDQDVFLPVYHPLVEQEEYDVDFLYGGRDSGKSRHIAQELIKDCLRLKYFRCVLARKVYNTVKESQWQLIKDIVEEWGLSRFFRFNKSPLEITCVNGNKFICRGFDDPGKLKSISNPSHCWIEEGNQISNDDFVIILTTLRSNHGNVKIWFSFNPECEVNYADFWLYKEWFAHTTHLSFTDIKEIEIDENERVLYKVRATHSTYKDNPYCKPQRKALYESYKNSKNNQYYYQTYTLGRWGLRKSGGEFWKCFDETRHVQDIVRRYDLQSRTDEQNAIHIVVDNNVNPYVSIQFWRVDAKNKKINQVGELPCEHPHNTATKAAKQAVKWLEKNEYPLNWIYLYGDPSANAKSTTDDTGKSFFDKFIAAIREEGYRVHDRVGKKAPGVAISGEFINEIFESNFEGWQITIDSGCRVSITDYTMVQEDVDGTMLKKKVKDSDTERTYEQYGHFSDCLRYFCVQLLPDVFQKFAQRRKIRSFSVPRD